MQGTRYDYVILIFGLKHWPMSSSLHFTTVCTSVTHMRPFSTRRGFSPICDTSCTICTSCELALLRPPGWHSTNVLSTSPPCVFCMSSRKMSNIPRLNLVWPLSKPLSARYTQMAVPTGPMLQAKHVKDDKKQDLLITVPSFLHWLPYSLYKPTHQRNLYCSWLHIYASSYLHVNITC